MKKLLIYPFGSESSPIVNSNLFEVIPISTKSSGFCNQDVSVVDGGCYRDINIFPEEKIKDFLEKADQILIVEDERIAKLENYVSFFNKIIDYKKEVYITKTLKTKLDTLGTIYPKNIKVIGFESSVYENINLSKNENYKLKFIKNIPIPVILILGDGANCNKFDLQLGVYNYFKDKGYVVELVGTKEYSHILGISSIPNFLFSPLLMNEKILKFNNFIYDKVISSNLDLIILSAPGGVSPLNNEFVEDFGEYSYIIANAVNPDILIRTLYQNAYDTDFLKDDSVRCNFKFLTSANIYNISNTNIIIPQEDYMSLAYLTLNYQSAIDRFQKDDIKNFDLFNLFDKNASREINKKIEDILVNNIAIV